MGALSPTHWLIIIGVLVLLFGAKRLPDAARSLGRSARILKAEVREAKAGEDTADVPASPTIPSAPVALPVSTATTSDEASVSPQPERPVTPPFSAA